MTVIELQTIQVNIWDLIEIFRIILRMVPFCLSSTFGEKRHCSGQITRIEVLWILPWQKFHAFILRSQFHFDSLSIFAFHMGQQAAYKI